MGIFKSFIEGGYCFVPLQILAEVVFNLFDFTERITRRQLTVSLRDRSFGVIGDGKHRCSYDSFEGKDITL